MARREEIQIVIKGNSATAKKAAKETQAALGKIDKKAKTTGISLKTLKSNFLGIAAATAGLVLGIKKVVGLAAEQEKQQLLLSQAMKQAGTFTQEAFNHNLEYAKSLQEMTTFGDEAILGVQRMLSNFGVEGEMLDKLTKATLDLATAKGMDLKAAADLVAKSVGSSTNALTRYGIEVKGAVGSTERMNMAAENITKIFGGSAQAMAGTFAGQVRQMKNALGDAGEEIGKVFFPLLRPMIIALKDAAIIFGSLPSPVKKTAVAVVGLGVALGTAVKIFGMSVSSAGILGAALLALVATYKGVTMAIEAGKRSQIGWTQVLDETDLEKARGDLELYRSEFERFKEENQLVSENFDKFAEAVVSLEMDPFIEKLNQGTITQEQYAAAGEKVRRKLEGIRMEWSKLITKIENTDKAIKAYNKTTKAREELSKQQMKMEALLETTKEKSAKNDDKRNKDELLREQTLYNAKNALNFQLFATRKKFAQAGVDAVVEAAASEKATLGDVAAALIESQAEALANVMKIKAVAAFASLNFVQGAAYTAAAAGIKAIGARVASALMTKKYGDGGVITEPVYGIGQMSGAQYVFGEKGMETVTPGPPEDEKTGGDTYIVNIENFNPVGDNAIEIMEEFRELAGSRGLNRG